MNTIDATIAMYERTLDIHEARLAEWPHMRALMPSPFSTALAAAVFAFSELDAVTPEQRARLDRILARHQHAIG